MSIAHGRVGDQYAFLVQHPLRKPLCAVLFQNLARAVGWCQMAQFWRYWRARVRGGKGAVLGLRVPVDRDIRDIGQDLCGSVPARLEIEELWRLVDELRVVFVVQKRRVFQQVFDKGDVSRHAADPEFAQCTIHSRNRCVRCRCPSGDLLQERVVIARDNGTGIGCPTVQPDAHTRGPAIRGDATIVGDEIVRWVLGRDPALDRMTRKLDLVLACRSRRFFKRFAFGDQNLGAHNVDAGDFFGHGMLDLNARVDLDEVKGAVFHIHQEFDRPGAFIADLSCDFATQFSQVLALGLAQIRGRGALNDFLVAPLDRAIALPKMIDASGLIAEDLNLDMAGFQDHLFQIPFAITKGGFRLATSL